MVIDRETTKKVQEKELYILKEIDRVCRLLKINYCVCGGTLLGAVRHGGFIPWDDDIDIIMPRKDFVRFNQEFQKYSGEEFFLQSKKTDPYYFANFTKIRLNGTIYGNERDKKLKHMGVWVDVFPADIGDAKHKDLLKKHKRISDLFTAYYANRLLSSNQRTIKWKVILILLRPWFARYLEKKAEQYFQKRLEHYDENQDLLFCETCSTYPFERVVFPYDKCYPFHEIQFSDLQTFSPHDEDFYLQTVYGNYMELPPIDQRVTVHDITIIDLD